MILFAGFIALIPAVFIARLALSKKTGPALKKFSIIALVCISLAFAVCTALLVFMVGFSKERGAGYGGFPVVPGNEPQKDISVVLIAAGVVLASLILVLILAIREQRRK